MAFKDVAHWSENNNIDHRPDIALYPTHEQAADMYQLSKEEVKKSSASEERKPYIARCAYPWMITAIEVKTASAETGFGFTENEPLLRQVDKSVDVRSQFATYAAEIMLRQHRTHLYMFYIAGWRARVFRWDRNGAIVSEPIDLRKKLKTLLDLMYRLIVADSKDQGFDTTATLATEAEIAKLNSYHTTNVYLKQYKRLMLDNKGEYPIFKVCVFTVSWFILLCIVYSDWVQRSSPFEWGEANTLLATEEILNRQTGRRRVCTDWAGYAGLGCVQP